MEIDGILPPSSSPPSTHTNSTNICPITLVRRQMISSICSISVACPTLNWSSCSYWAAVFEILER